MLFTSSSSFVSLVFMVATTAAASDLKFGRDYASGLETRATSCSAGQFLSNYICYACPAGNFCPGGTKGPQQCDLGYYQPDTGKSSCIGTLPGNYQPEKGKTVSLPCPLGTYQTSHHQLSQSDANKGFCYGASSGRFQSKTGQTGSCGVCCGWYTTQTNNNFQIYKCPAGTSSGRGSGSGCTNQGVGRLQLLRVDASRSVLNFSSLNQPLSFKRVGLLEQTLEALFQGQQVGFPIWRALATHTDPRRPDDVCGRVSHESRAELLRWSLRGLLRSSARGAGWLSLTGGRFQRRGASVEFVCDAAPHGTRLWRARPAPGFLTASEAGRVPLAHRRCPQLWGASRSADKEKVHTALKPFVVTGHRRRPTLEPSPAPEDAAFTSITSSTSCWNHRDCGRLVTVKPDGARILRVGTEKEAVPGRSTEKEVVPAQRKRRFLCCMLLSSKGLSGGGDYTCRSFVIIGEMHQHGGSERGRIVSEGRRGVGGGLGESGISTYRQGDAAGGHKGGAACEDIGDSEARMNNETMLLVWAMPPLAAAHLAHIGALGLGTFSEDEAEEHVDNEEKEEGKEGEVVACRGKARDLPTGTTTRVDTLTLKLMLNSKLPKYDENKVWRTAGYFRTDDFNMSDKVGAIWIHMDASWWKAGIQAAKKSWLPAGDIVGPVFVDISWAAQLEAAQTYMSIPLVYGGRQGVDQGRPRSNDEKDVRNYLMSHFREDYPSKHITNNGQRVMYDYLVDLLQDWVGILAVGAILVARAWGE
ncbi:hypothetical protein C8J57DRAFT_1590160 [Mycena rebaudengoi]|nr:hypothetical protein C8J57DRAFT_1590160 [Mycena rebaudengoi]